MISLCSACSSLPRWSGWARLLVRSLRTIRLYIDTYVHTYVRTILCYGKWAKESLTSSALSIFRRARRRRRLKPGSSTNHGRGNHFPYFQSRDRWVHETGKSRMRKRRKGERKIYAYVHICVWRRGEEKGCAHVRRSRVARLTVHPEGGVGFPHA